MANYLDFLVAFDDHIRQSSLGYVGYGNDLHGIAREAGFVVPADFSAARWTGELVSAGYMTHGPLGGGDRRPLPVGGWVNEDLSRVSDYRITATGREEADRIRRQRREDLTDITLAGAVPDLLRAPMSDPQRAALSIPVTSLRAALDNGHHAAAVGAAKDLVEAVCKIVIQHAGSEPASGASLPTLFKQALAARGADHPGDDLGRSLSAAVQRLAEVRNAVGTGHGRATQPEVTARDARLSASAAVGIALYLGTPDL